MPSRLTPDGKKICTKCKIEKPKDEFYERKDRKGYLTSWCKPCIAEGAKKDRPNKKEIQQKSDLKHRPKRNAQRREKYAVDLEYKAKVQARNLASKNTGRSRAYHLKRTYGITPEQYDFLLEKQNYRCAVCDRHESEFSNKLAVDHDHKTGEIFGLLCAFDNHRLIGRNRDPNRFRRAADYLEKGTGWIVPKKKPKRKIRKRKVKI